MDVTSYDSCGDLFWFNLGVSQYVVSVPLFCITCLDIQILHVGVGVLFLPNHHIHPYGFMLDIWFRDTAMRVERPVHEQKPNVCLYNEDWEYLNTQFRYIKYVLE